jgi:cell division GTPase FtsZ
VGVAGLDARHVGCRHVFHTSRCCCCLLLHVGILTAAIVTYPFSFEGRRRAQQAMKGISALKECVDCLIIIPNDKLLDVTDRSTSLNDAFRKADDVLRQGVQVRKRETNSKTRAG